MHRHLSLIFLASLLTLTGCLSKGGESLPGLGNGAVASSTNTKPLLFLRITNGVTTNPHPGTTLNPGQSITLKAVLVGDSGTIVETVPVSWSVSGTLESGDLRAANGSAEDVDAVFSATKIAAGNISATVTNLDGDIFKEYSLSSSTTMTGSIKVNHTLVEDSLSIISGNGQTAPAGTMAPASLVVKVVNVGGDAIPGATVTFESAIANNGGIILCGGGSGQATTDSNGIASCQVKLGGNLGSNNQTFTARISQGSSPTIDFNLTATYGVPYKLGFIQEPIGASRGISMIATPITVAVQDQFGNIVPTAAHSITLDKYSGDGSGVLGGSLTFNAGNGGTGGVAKFTTLSYTLAETNVKIRATANPALLTAVSTSFDVSDVIQEARCASETTGFYTAEGGCRDSSSGLIWSASSDISPARPAAFSSNGQMNYGQAIWDEGQYALGMRNATETDLNLTNDYDVNRPNKVPDNFPLAYCHELNESGYDDWRMPNIDEYIQVSSNGSVNNLKDVANRHYWSSSSDNVPGWQAYIVRIDSTPWWGMQWVNNAWYARCVRRSPPAKLIFKAGTPNAPTEGLGVNMPFEVAPVVYVTDAQGLGVARAGVLVKLTAHKQSDNSQVNLTYDNVSRTEIIRATDAWGSVTFTGVGSAFAGNIYLKAVGTNTVGTSIDYTQLTPGQSYFFTVNSQYPLGKCKVENSIWMNATGGCKDKSTGLIWSSFSGTKYRTWNDAVWDANVLGATASDVHDSFLQNDYDQTQGFSGNDDSPRSYCKDSMESAQEDWRMPMISELYSMSSKTPIDNLNFTNPGQWVWASTVRANGSAEAYSLRFTDRYVEPWYNKNQNFQTICVRRDPPTGLNIAVSGSTQLPTYAIGQVFQVTVKALDADGAPSSASGTVNLALGTGATGSIFESGINKGQNFSVYMTNGLATFNVSYNRNETIKFIATGTVTWKGANIVLTPTESAMIDFDPLVSATCKLSPAPGWTNDSLGGCLDTSTNLTWSPVTRAEFAWYDYTARVGTCTAYNLGGYTNWRIPTTAEWNAAAASHIEASLQDFYTQNAYGILEADNQAFYTSSLAVSTNYGGISTRCVRSN